MKPLDLKWSGLDPKIHPILLDILVDKLNFKTVMPVQKAVIPLIEKNYDVAVESCTGSGKTLSFLIPIFDFLLKNHETRIKKRIIKLSDCLQPEKRTKVIIISPTRELAQQTSKVATEIATAISEYGNLEYPILNLIGGHAQKTNKGPNPTFVIATPGRLREVLFEKTDIKIHTADLEFLIMDEADRLIEGNHRLDIRDILSKLPKQRRTGLFSATLNNVKIDELIRLGLRNPAKVKLKTSDNNPLPNEENNFAMPENLTNSFILFQNRFEKIMYIFKRIRKLASTKSIIFFNTCHSVDFYYKLLRAYCPDIEMVDLHGQMDQKKRDKIFARFNNEKIGILIATDVIARGIDFGNVQYIFQVDAPQQPENFIHRIGRTARGFCKGKSIYLGEKYEYAFIKYLEEKGVKFSIKKKCLDAEDSEIIESKLKSIMLGDRDYLIKSKRAFISFLRSYKEHILKNIFIMENLDIYDVTRSFVLPIVPKLKEFTTEHGKRVLDEEYLKKSQSVEFSDQNQAKQFKEKEEILLKKREKFSEQKRILRIKAEKEKFKKKKRSFSDRQKSKINQLEIEFSELAYETTWMRKLKKGLISEKEFEKQMEKIERKYIRELED